MEHRNHHPIGLRIHADAVAVVEMVRPYRIRIEREDPDHARQLRRAVKSIPLNIAESQGGRGRNGKVRLATALTSARETWSCLEVAVADGIVDSIDHALLDRLSKVIGTLVKLTR